MVNEHQRTQGFNSSYKKVNQNLDANFPLQAQNNTVSYQIDKNGPGGSWTHDLSTLAAILDVESIQKRVSNPYKAIHLF
ncbi:MAG TPA: hypothetical protein VJ799_10270 [Nitrososphaeraceae archaeon]|nr:hypothetical protein [Nitrososphaeraceae archaeon]